MHGIGSYGRYLLVLSKLAGGLRTNASNGAMQGIRVIAVLVDRYLRESRSDGNARDGSAELSNGHQAVDGNQMASTDHIPSG